MKLSVLLELLLILIIIAFAASKPLQKSGRALKRLDFEGRQKQSVVKNQTSAEIDDDYDDDLFDLAGDDDDDDEEDETSDGNKDGNKKDGETNDKPAKPTNVIDEDDEDLDDEDDEEDDDEKETPSDEDVDASEFLLFGEDLFGFFDDDEDTKKKVTNKPVPQKTTPVVPTTPRSNPIKTQSQTVIPLETVQAVVNQLTPESSADMNAIKTNSQLVLQHTPALLELVQTNMVQKDKISDGLKQQNDENDIKPSEQEANEDSEEEDDFIVVSDEKQPLQNEDNNLVEPNIVQDSDKDTAVVDTNEKIVETSSKSPVKISSTLAPKKPTKKPDDSILGLVEQFISDEDEDDETAVAQSNKNDGTRKPTKVDNDDDNDDEDEEDDVATEEESEEQNAIKNKNKNKNKKKKQKPDDLIGSIGATLGLSRKS